MCHDFSEPKLCMSNMSAEPDEGTLSEVVYVNEMNRRVMCWTFSTDHFCTQI